MPEYQAIHVNSIQRNLRVQGRQRMITDWLTDANLRVCAGNLKRVDPSEYVVAKRQH